MSTFDSHKSLIKPLKFDPVGTKEFHGTQIYCLLPQNITEVARLKHQHQFYTSTTDGQLLAIPVGDIPSLRILDAGCANGQWLSELPFQYPAKNLSLYGIDIVPSLFEHRPSSPPSDLRKHNVLAPIPIEWGWVNSFDVVHQRLLMWTYRSEEWPKVISNLLTVLKPGGYIQLVEVQWVDLSVPLTELPPILQKQAIMQAWLTESTGTDINIAYKLADLLREARCFDVTEVKFEHGYGCLARDKSFAEYSAQLIVQYYRSLDKLLGDNGIPGVAKDAREFNAFLDDLEIYIRMYGYKSRLNFVYGRKPYI